ncbi:MAG: response regulator transcription factor [Lachnospiraceae bacterium]|nr:response regulator transcription factor [Lachnospiraceae bacterium]
MRLLLVEDEEGFAEALTASLKMEHYITDWAKDGEEGLNLGMSNIYDAIILDIMLPKMNGLMVLKQLREQGIHTPILLLTAKSELEDKVTGLDSGADDYLTKPFHREELYARLRALTRRPAESTTSQELSYGDLYMLQGSNELYCKVSGNSLPLNGKEYQLMEYLLRNAGQIITREQIIEKIWGYDTEAEYNSVEVYISFLRKKMTFLKTEVSIQTARKLGYKLTI